MTTRAVIRLADERRYDVPVALVCAEFTPAQAKEWIEHGQAPELAKSKEVSFIDIGSGHWPMISAPAEFARLRVRRRPPPDGPTWTEELTVPGGQAEHRRGGVAGQARR